MLALPLKNGTRNYEIKMSKLWQSEEAALRKREMSGCGELPGEKHSNLGDSLCTLQDSCLLKHHAWMQPLSQGATAQTERQGTLMFCDTY